MNEYRINSIKSLRESIRAVTTGELKGVRNELSKVVRMIVSAEAFFPEKPKYINSGVANFLVRKVDASCPRCVNPSTMERKIKDVTRLVSEYAKKLDVYLGTHDVEKKSIHELKPTNND